MCTNCTNCIRCGKCKIFLHDYVQQVFLTKGTYTDFLRKKALLQFANDYVLWLLRLMELLPWPQFLIAQGLADSPNNHFQIFHFLLERNPWLRPEFEYIRTRMLEEGIVNMKEKECPFRIMEYYLADTIPPLLRAAYETHYYHTHPEIAAKDAVKSNKTIFVAVALQQDEEDLYA